MASLENVKVKDSYTSLLKLSGNTDTLVAGASGDAIQVVDGNGDASPLYLNTDRLGIGGQPTNPLSVTGAVDVSSSLAIGDSTITTSGGNTPQIQTHKTNNSNGLGIFQWGNNGAHSAMLSLSHSKSGTIGSHTILADNDAIGTIQFNGSDGTNFDTLGASIHVEVDGTPAANRIPSAMIFSTSAVSDDGITERMRITSAGNVGIGTNSPNTSLHVNNTATSSGSIAEFYRAVDADGEYVAQWMGKSASTGDALALSYYYDTGTDAYAELSIYGSNGLVVKEGGNVGIGTTAPTDYHADADNLVIYSSGNTGMTIASGASNSSNIFFANGTSGTAEYNGAFQFLHGSTTFAFGIGNSTVMKLDANSRISLSNNDSGTQNTVFGHGAGANIDTGTNYNVFVGHNVAGATLDDATENTGVGYSALANLTTGDNNTAIGRSALINLNTGTDNVAVGIKALEAVTDSQYNVGVGRQAAFKITTGDKNISIGAGTLATATTASSIIAIGHDAAYSVSASSTTSDGTVAIGDSALNALSSGAKNIAIGYQSGDAITSGGENTLLGYSAGGNFDTNAGNVAIGSEALSGAGDASYCVAVGKEALKGALTSAANGSVAVGSNALQANTSGERNLAVGYQALLAADVCDDSIAIGYQALSGTDAGACNKNIAIGNYALDGALVTSVNNVAIGYNALTASTSGTANVAIGGNLAGGNITTASNIVAIGDGALGGAAQSQGNTGVGYASLYSTTGAKNTAFGYQSANTVTSGSENTVVGWDADVTGSGAVNQTVIGSETTGVTDNSVTLGNSSVTKVYMSQDGDAEMYANGTINTSDKRLKQDIKNTDLGLDFINELRPVSYKLKKDKQINKIKYGIIAQEVQEVLKKTNNQNFAGITDKGDFLGADYVQFIAPLMKAVQELSAKVTELENKLK